jgi:arsenite-transporting ATPase
VRFLTGQRILFFGGKGGVGKTTCSTAAALAASRQGRRVLLASTDPAHSIADVTGCALDAAEREISPGLHALEIDAHTEVHRYLDEARKHLAAAFNPAMLGQALRQIELTATMPGVEDVAVFERMTEILLTRQRDFDLVVFDTAPTGHALRLLNLPESMGVWVRALADRRREARDARAVAFTAGDGAEEPADPVLAALDRRADRLERVRSVLMSRYASVVLVLVPERLPIEETARSLAVLAGARIRVGALVINRVLPEGASGEFYRSRKAQERVYLDEIEHRFAAHPLVRVPQLETDVHGLADLTRVAEALGA